MDTFKTPRPQETMAGYVKRIRSYLKMTQFELALAAGIHPPSVGKIERGRVTKVNRKTMIGLALALGVAVEYLDAVSKGLSVYEAIGVKFCPRCWTPGSITDPTWGDVKAKFCYLCGTQLRNSCSRCGEIVTSLRHRYCPICGHPYKETFNAKI